VTQRKQNPITGNKPFKKGQSGNPKGRPKKLPELDALLADVLGEENANGMQAARLVLMALRKRAFAGDVRAAEVLLDRAWGKSRQSVDINVDLSQMSDEQLARIADGKLPV
jgi:uncharacterized protein YjiS (DUF1127 family)